MNISNKICLGYIFIPAATIGLVSGSVVMSGFKLVHRKALQMCIVVSLLGWFAQFAFALYCDDPAVAGVNTVLDMKYDSSLHVVFFRFFLLCTILSNVHLLNYKSVFYSQA